MWTTDGYVADDFNTIMNNYYVAFTAEYGQVTMTRFRASREYEIFYASAQVDMQYQAIFSEIFNKITDWMNEVNFKINSPSTTNPAIRKAFLDRFGIKVGIKPMIESESGMMHLALDYTPEDNLNNQIANYMANEAVAGGIVTEGDIVVYVPIGGQSFPYKWVQAVEKTVKFKVKVTVSRTSSDYLESEADIRDRFLANYEELYEIGYDIEPESYFEINRDARYASEILTQYSFDDGETWFSLPYASEYSDKFVPELNTQDIEIVRPT